MSDVESDFSFTSPSVSPTFPFETTWSVVAEGESSKLPLVEAGEEDSPPNGRYNDDHAGDVMHSSFTTSERASLNNESKSKAAMRSAATATVGDGDVNSAQSQQHQQRGRTHRKRSSATQPYVCVVVWLVRPPKNDVKARNALDQVQEIRRKHDNAYRRWEPHITLVPPFVVPFKQNTDSGTWLNDLPGGIPTSAASTTAATTTAKSSRTASYSIVDDTDDVNGNADDNVRRLTEPRKVLSVLSKRIARVCAEQAGNGKLQEVAFEQVSKFALRRYDTYHLRPSSTAPGLEALTKLQQALVNALPEAWEFSRGAFSRRPQRQQKYSAAATLNVEQQRSASEFNPHLTLGQATTPEKGKEIEAQALALLDLKQEGGGPLGVSLDAIQLMWKPVSQSGPYEVFQEFCLAPPLQHDVNNA